MYSVETQGIEWDWFASDGDGHVALFASGGSGQVPPVLLEHEDAIAELLQFLGIRCDRESWAVAARGGIFGYDVDVNGGPFRRVSVPSNPILLEQVPEPHRSLISRVTVHDCFSRLRWLDGSKVRF
tara:strand:+ start:3991 stop:4368 length:378 start_codon:yes stop_codon:yes gene_type:complete